MKVKQIQVSGELFEAVQQASIFSDSKTFVDAIANANAGTILDNYRNLRSIPGFDLVQFVEKNFKFARNLAKPILTDRQRSMPQHISQLWDNLMRQADRPTSGQESSLLELPYPYIVPGGRFSEIYYWDSYFTAEGLAADERLEIVINMANNFSYLIKQYGIIPNGNRSYYLSRSQPPFFVSLVEIIFKHSGIQQILPYLQSLDQEYRFWMSGSRAVILPNGMILNRYWDNNPIPRPESYREDTFWARNLNPDQRRTFFRNIRAACESGWDFSSRWFADGHNLETIITTQILPIDLNSILFGMEATLANWHSMTGNQVCAKYYQLQATSRCKAINYYLWNDQKQSFVDYNYQTRQQMPTLSLAAVYPLFFKLASQQQAEAIAKLLETKFLQTGGLLTTLNQTQEQWDSPNGWAPLHWIAICGLLNYGQRDLAYSIARCFIGNVYQTYLRSGKMMEKYNVSSPNLSAAGGEYPLQDGFGWTNGVVSAVMKLFPTLEYELMSN